MMTMTVMKKMMMKLKMVTPTKKNMRWWWLC